MNYTHPRLSIGSTKTLPCSRVFGAQFVSYKRNQRFHSYQQVKGASKNYFFRYAGVGRGLFLRQVNSLAWH